MTRKLQRRRSLSIQSLEGRRLLASLASRLPPIRVAADEPVVIADTLGQTYEVSNASLRALRELEQLFEMDDSIAMDNVNTLSRLTWSQLEASGQAITPPTLQQATQIATIGFAPVELAGFGDSLSSRSFTSVLGGDVVNVTTVAVERVVADVDPDTGELENDVSQLTSLELSTKVAAQAEADALAQSRLRESDGGAPVNRFANVFARHGDSIQLSVEYASSTSVEGRSTSQPLQSFDSIESVWLKRETDTAQDRAAPSVDSGHPSRTWAEAIDPVAGMLWMSIDDADAVATVAEASGKLAAFDPFGIVQMFIGETSPQAASVQWPMLASFSSLSGEAAAAITELTVPQRWSISSAAAVLVAGYLYQTQILPRRCETKRQQISLSK